MVIKCRGGKTTFYILLLLYTVQHCSSTYLLHCRYIQLENGIRVLLVSNESSNTSAAALDIRVGNFSDPVNLQGLAHLCEHVLFTGSEAFPTESYSEFIGTGMAQ